jgi:hypothetical protein
LIAVTGRPRHAVERRCLVVTGFAVALALL